jgi:mono/diheme cytochrome c family protein
LDGKNDMPGYSNVLTYEEAENVLQYIREDLKRR